MNIEDVISRLSNNRKVLSAANEGAASILDDKCPGTHAARGLRVAYWDALRHVDELTEIASKLVHEELAGNCNRLVRSQPRRLLDSIGPFFMN